MKLKIPGNLLLVGEYSVTIPGGKGIGTAIDTWACITAEPHDMLTIECKFNNKDYSQSYSPGQMPLIDCVLKNLRKYFELKKIPFPNSFKVYVDTSDFYLPNGRKKGFGSSAAVVVGLTSLFLKLALNHFNTEEVFPLALSIHRDFQGGRGSGYDIAASLYGGIGLFTGGILPIWQPITPAWVNNLRLIEGDEEVSTKQALAAFSHFLSHHSDSKSFINQSNELVTQLAQCKDSVSAKLSFKKAAELNQWIHHQLDISSEGPRLKKLLDQLRANDCPGKALGAGGEIAAVMVERNTSLVKNFQPLNVSYKGIKWET